MFQIAAGEPIPPRITLRKLKFAMKNAISRISLFVCDVKFLVHSTTSVPQHDWQSAPACLSLKNLSSGIIWEDWRHVGNL